jgi:FtsH-binding integral membrane protein
MSAWRIGTGGETPPEESDPTFGGPEATGNTPAQQLNAFVQTVTEWIPADVLAIYLAGVTYLASAANAKPSLGFLAAMTVVTPIAVFLGAFSVGNPINIKLGIRALLALLGFLIWTLTVPFSGWQSFDVVAANSGVVAVASAVGGLLFGLLAQGISRRLTG